MISEAINCTKKLLVYPALCNTVCKILSPASWYYPYIPAVTHAIKKSLTIPKG